METEKRLIDANALIDWLTKHTGFRGNCEDCTDMDCLDCIVENCVKNFPTVDAVEVVHGRWVEVRNRFGYCIGMKCSRCGRRVRNCGENYCPHCGADMRERKDNGN